MAKMSLKLAACPIAVATLSACLSGPALAGTVLLTDNFNSDATALNWPGDTVFASTSPVGNAPNAASTDLIGPGFFPLCAAGQGNCVDLDGSSGNNNLPDAGQLTSNAAFGPGTYTVHFALAGNQRSAPAQTTEITLGSFSKDVTLQSSDPWANYSYTFTTTTGGNLQFTDFGPSDQQGNLLDNVVFEAGVPEPATWMMMLLGVASIGAGLRLGRRDSSAPASA